MMWGAGTEDTHLLVRPSTVRQTEEENANFAPDDEGDPEEAQAIDEYFGCQRARDTSEPAMSESGIHEYRWAGGDFDGRGTDGGGRPVGLAPGEASARRQTITTTSAREARSRIPER